MFPVLGLTAPSARRQALDILSGSAFRQSRLPRPLAGLVATVARWTEPLHRELANLSHLLRGRYPLFVFAAVLAATALIAGPRVIQMVGFDTKRRSGASALVPKELSEAEDRIGALEGRAKTAEDEGEWETALRLRFAIGVARLEKLGAVHDQEWLTTRQLEAALASSAFVAVAREHERVAYGAAPASHQQLQETSLLWQALLADRKVS